MLKLIIGFQNALLPLLRSLKTVFQGIFYSLSIFLGVFSVASSWEFRLPRIECEIFLNQKAMITLSILVQEKLNHISLWVRRRLLTFFCETLLHRKNSKHLGIFVDSSLKCMFLRKPLVHLVKISSGWRTIPRRGTRLTKEATCWSLLTIWEKYGLF